MCVHRGCSKKVAVCKLRTEDPEEALILDLWPQSGEKICYCCLSRVAGGALLWQLEPAETDIGQVLGLSHLSCPPFLFFLRGQDSGGSSSSSLQSF